MELFNWQIKTCFFNQLLDSLILIAKQKKHDTLINGFNSQMMKIRKKLYIYKKKRVELLAPLKKLL